jgi:NAD(P)-dependent dehydrogenase (short-subunit alcohol dehydrogenase family)
MKLSSHRALITGAGQGIGRACAEVFAARGAALILLDKNPETLSQVAESLAGSGSKVISRVVDLTETERLHAVMEEVMDTGPIDILVNNAGFDRPGTSARITREAFLEVIEIHVMVPLTLIQLLLPGMRAAGWGRIINISSIYGITGAKGELAYCTAKAGIIGLTKSVAKEAAADGVTVNAVVPGLIRTPTIENFMAEKYKLLVINDTPAGRIGEAEEVARLVAFLASEDASYVTGSAVPVSGGWGI